MAGLREVLRWVTEGCANILKPGCQTAFKRITVPRSEVVVWKSWGRIGVKVKRLMQQIFFFEIMDLWQKFLQFLATHSSTLAWKIPWTEEPSRLQSMGLQRVRHDWATSFSFYVVATLLTIAKIQKQSTLPSVNEWIKKMSPICESR